MTGAEYIAEFLKQRGIDNVFLVTGGACAFIVDAIGRNPGIDYTCFQHEQSAAMAADAIWRTRRIVGATLVTSGPGATNLITGIACSYFDSIPAIHITGQVNQNEELNYRGAYARQSGFQETNIVEMVKPVTKYAVKVTNPAHLKYELNKAYNIAITARMGPVLLDIPMDVQQAEVGTEIEYEPLVSDNLLSDSAMKTISSQVDSFLQSGERPLVLFGAGIGLADAEADVENWLVQTNVPFVSSWNGMSFFDHRDKNYCGEIGVYGNRGANFLIQNCDRLLVLGSRLDNRQRSGDANSFARSARVLVLDVDIEELKKYQNNPHFESGIHLDLKSLPQILRDLRSPIQSDKWQSYWQSMKKRYFGKHHSSAAEKFGTISPFEAIKQLSEVISDDAIVIADTGATVCWFFQSFFRTEQTIFTSGGNSPMGYSLPAAIGAAIFNPESQVIAIIGDGGMQMNIQELQTMKHHNLNIKLVIMNNFGYGIIKQFQDSYTDGRYSATGEGYSQPDFGKVVQAYGINYERVETVAEIKDSLFVTRGPSVVEIALHPDTLIEPKLEMGHSIEDQFPYLSDDEYDQGMELGINARNANSLSR